MRKNRDMRRSPAVRAALMARRSGAPANDAVPRLEPVTKPLNARQRRFVEEYLIDLNANAAARRAGYKVQPHGSYGHHLKALPQVAALIAERVAVRSAALSVTADRIMAELGNIAFADWEQVAKAIGPGLSLAPKALECVSSISVKAWPKQGAGRASVEMKFDRLKALETLARIMGLWGRLR